MTQPTPPEALALGSVIKEYKAKTVVGPLLGIGLGAVMLVGGFVSATVAEDGGFGFGICLLGGVVVLVNVMNVVGAYRRRRMTVTRHEKGIVYTDGKETLVLPYGEIASTRLEVRGTRRNRYRVYHLVDRRTNRDLALSQRHIDGVIDLGDTVIDEVTAHLLMQAGEAIRRGETVQAGGLGISQQGLHQGDDLLRWDEIEFARLYRGHFTIKRKDERKLWFQSMIAAAPNGTLLLKMVDEGVHVEGL